MSALAFTPATKKQAKLRLALEGPAGFGKTYTALTLATNLVPSSKIAFVDTEAGSASKYAHLFSFDVIEMEPPFDPRRAAEAIGAAVAGGYDVVIVDSLSHFWQGKGGLLEIVDNIGLTKYRGDLHRAWAEGGEIERELIDAILRSPIHVIGAMRTKKDYVRTTDENGKTKIRAAGTKTIQREEFDFEFDLVGRFDVPAVLTVIKTRVDTLPPETVIDKPGADTAGLLRAWLEDGTENAAIERPTMRETKKLDTAIGRLAEIKPEVDWHAKADASARRKFGHGVESLSKAETAELAKAMDHYATELALTVPQPTLAGAAS